jgi:TPR repeat protein
MHPRRYHFQYASHPYTPFLLLGTKKYRAESLFQEGRQLCAEQRFSDAEKSWSQAALLNHGPSHAFLSEMLFYGRPHVVRDRKRAYELALAGVALGCKHSKGALADCYVQSSYDADFPGDKTLRLNLGLAVARESQEAGSCLGQTVVAWFFQFGVCVAQDYAEAARLYHLATVQGHARAQMILGNLFRDGHGVAQDSAEAVRLYHLAAAQGDAEGQANLGYMFFQGSGTAKNYAEAVRLLRLAAAQGHVRAQCSLGIWLRSICPDLARDPAEGVSWLRIAAAQGNVRAQCIMGNIAEKGEKSVEVDRTEAIRWFSLAAAQGDIEGADGLRRLQCR